METELEKEKKAAHDEIDTLEAATPEGMETEFKQAREDVTAVKTKEDVQKIRATLRFKIQKKNAALATFAAKISANLQTNLKKRREQKKLPIDKPAGPTND